MVPVVESYLMTAREHEWVSWVLVTLFFLIWGGSHTVARLVKISTYGLYIFLKFNVSLKLQ